MNSLSGLGSGPTVMTPPILWALIAVIVALCVGIGVVRFVAVRKAKAEAEAARELQALRAVPQSCRANGHAYREYDTGWRCVTCGNFVPRRDGELYGLVAAGRHERRRQPR
jgi:hypothetical protein